MYSTIQKRSEERNRDSTRTSTSMQCSPDSRSRRHSPSASVRDGAVGQVRTPGGWAGRGDKFQSVSASISLLLLLPSLLSARPPPPLSPLPRPLLIQSSSSPPTRRKTMPPSTQSTALSGSIPVPYHIKGRGYLFLPSKVPMRVVHNTLYKNNRPPARRGTHDVLGASWNLGLSHRPFSRCNPDDPSLLSHPPPSPPPFNSVEAATPLPSSLSV